MATTDMNAQIHIKDGNGNVNNIFPATKIANVEGLTSALNAKADTTTVNNQLTGKVDKENGKGLSTNDYTTAEKNKLSGIEAQANKTTVDSALSTTSTNPVQNKVVKAALDEQNSDLVAGLATKADSSTVSSLSSQVSTNTTNIATQTARIDAIAALPSGSTSGDAELMDIRTKADGTTTTNAGSAVREQVTELNGKISDINQIVKYKNYYHEIEFVNNTFIRSQDGAERSNQDYISSTFVALDDVVYLMCDKIATLAFYSNNTGASAFISAYSSLNPLSKCVVPSNANYFRICYAKSMITSEDPIINIHKTINSEMTLTVTNDNSNFSDESVPQSAILDFKKISSGYFNLGNTNYINNSYVRTQDGGIRDLEGYKRTDYISISEYDSLVLNNNCYFCTYDSSFAFIRACETAGKYTVANNEKYCIISGQSEFNFIVNAIKANEDTPDVYMDFKGSVFKAGCIPSDAIDGMPSAISDNLSVVAPDGYGGKYTSVAEATAKSDGTDTVLVTRGTYNETSWQIANDTYGNKRTYKSVVGYDKRNTIVQRSGTAYADDVLHTGLNCYLSNLSLKAIKANGASTCGYALHADNNWLADGGKNEFDNCCFYSNGRQAVGIGSRPNCNLIFRNCEFITESDNAGAVFFHNSNDSEHLGAHQRITFENCTFHAAKGRALTVGVIGDDNNSIDLTINRCVFISDDLDGEDIIEVSKSSYTGSRGININLINCFGNNIDVSQYIKP